MAHLLNPGDQEMWWCPSCGCVLHKPPKVHDGERFHSWKCPLPMVRSTITVAPHGGTA